MGMVGKGRSHCSPLKSGTSAIGGKVVPFNTDGQSRGGEDSLTQLVEVPGEGSLAFGTAGGWQGSWLYGIEEIELRFGSHAFLRPNLFLAL